MQGIRLAAPIGALLLCVAAWASVRGDADMPGPVTIGIIQLTEVDTQTFAGLKEGLADQGFAEGEDVTYHFEGPAGSVDRLPGQIDRMLERGVDLIVVSSTPGSQAVLKATQGRDLPIVFAPVNNPLSAGIVDDLSRPGGMVTGIRLPRGDDLRLDWLRRILPEARTVVVPHVASDSSSASSVAIAAKAAATLGVRLVAEPVSSCAEAAGAVERHAGSADAVFLPRDSFVESCIDDLVAAANRLRIPVAAPSLTQVRRGALFSYGFVHAEIGRRAAHQVGQVLRGVPPGDLPVEAAESYLAINTRAAEAIGLGLPDEILVLADIVVRE